MRSACRTRTPGRHPHVRDALLALLREYDIAYLKWDHNRDLVDAGHGGRPAVHGQTLAVYRLRRGDQRQRHGRGVPQQPDHQHPRDSHPDHVRRVRRIRIHVHEVLGRDTLFVVVVGLLVIPIQITFVPMLQLLGSDGLGIVGQFLSVWLLHTAFGMPLAIYLLRNYMATLPKSVIESAEVDGATHFKTFWQLIVPMSVPALAAFAIFQFLWVWNDLLIALLFIGQGENEAVTVNLTQLNGRLGEGWQLLTAGAFVSMVVPLLVFFSLQRFFVRGLTSGSVKG